VQHVAYVRDRHFRHVPYSTRPDYHTELWLEGTAFRCSDTP
jgi:hypothetical protein